MLREDEAITARILARLTYKAYRGAGNGRQETENRGLCGHGLAC